MRNLKSFYSVDLIFFSTKSLEIILAQAAPFFFFFKYSWINAAIVSSVYTTLAL